MTSATPVISNNPQQLADEGLTVTTAKPANVKEVLAYLYQHYPHCFTSSGDIKPLKVGIFQDLVTRLAEGAPISKTQLRQALRVYTSSWRYLEATKEGVCRVDLDGQPGELIDAQQAEHAVKILVESKQKAAEKRKTKQQAQKVATQGNQTATKHAVVPREAKSGQKRPNKTSNQPSNREKTSLKMSHTSLKPDIAVATPGLIAVPASQLHVGMAVMVKLGSSPMPAAVTEVNLPDVTVQLSSGMVIKTRQDSLFLE